LVSIIRHNPSNPCFPQVGQDSCRKRPITSPLTSGSFHLQKVLLRSPFDCLWKWIVTRVRRSKVVWLMLNSHEERLNWSLHGSAIKESHLLPSATLQLYFHFSPIFSKTGLNSSEKEVIKDLGEPGIGKESLLIPLVTPSYPQIQESNRVKRHLLHLHIRTWFPCPFNVFQTSPRGPRPNILDTV